jgi:cell division protein FtsB
VDSRNRAFVERALPLTILTAALASVPYMALSPQGLNRLERLREERHGMNAELERLTREIRSLRSQVQRIKEDPAAVERVARDELGLIRKTEVVFHFSQ